MRMALFGHQFLWAFADTLGTTAAKEPAMVEKELQQAEIRGSQLTAQKEIIAQPRVEIFDERTGAWNVFHYIGHSADDALEFPGKLAVQEIPALPVSG